MSNYKLLMYRCSHALYPSTINLMYVHINYNQRLKKKNFKEAETSVIIFKIYGFTSMRLNPYWDWWDINTFLIFHSIRYKEKMEEVYNKSLLIIV